MLQRFRVIAPTCLRDKHFTEEHFCENAPTGPHITILVARIQKLLWRHIRHRPPTFQRSSLSAWRSESEICQLQNRPRLPKLLLQQQIRRLDIPVNKPPRMHVRHRVKKITQETTHIIHGKQARWRLFHDSSQITGIAQLQRYMHHGTALNTVKHTTDVRVLQSHL